MNPGSKLSIDLFRKVIENAYWSIYGELNLIDKFKNCLDNGVDCPQNLIFNYVSYMVYLVFVNVRL